MGKPSRCQHRERPAESIGGYEPTQGSEPSQYLEEKKATAIPLVAASERGNSPNPAFLKAVASGKWLVAGEERRLKVRSLLTTDHWPLATASRRVGGCRARVGEEP